MVEFHLRVMRGDVVTKETRVSKWGEPYDYVRTPSIKERQASANELLDRLLGKPKETLQVEGAPAGGRFDLTRASADDVASLAQVFAKLVKRREEVEGEIVSND